MKIKTDTEQKAKNIIALINTKKSYPILSTNARTGEIDPNAQQTTEWDKTKKAKDLDMWYFEKPDDTFLEGITDFEVAEFDDSWEE